METLKLDPERIQLSWISASEGKRYVEIVNEFSDKIEKLGPNPLANSSQF